MMSALRLPEPLRPRTSAISFASLRILLILDSIYMGNSEVQVGYVVY